MHAQVNGKNKWQGFTIVELLIVIVVIAVLSAITVVSYVSVSQRAKEVAVQADAKEAANQAVIAQATEGRYPNDGSGFTSGGGTTYEYSVNNTTTPPTFCVTATNGDISFFIDQTGIVNEGLCPGHSGGSGSAAIAWTESSIPLGFWSELFVSADGTKYVATANNSVYYRSSNSGQNWTQGTSVVSGYLNRGPGALNADGSVLLLSAYGNGGIHSARSTNLGTSWANTQNYNQASSIKISGNNSVAYYAQTWDYDNDGGGIFRSTNGGVSWTNVYSSAINWLEIAVNADGTRLVGVPTNGYLKRSTNSGSTWTDSTGPGIQQWKAVQISDDGQKILAHGTSSLFLSSDGGVTWSTVSGLPTVREIAMSGDGTTMLVTPFSNGYMYSSKDGGTTWSQEIGAGQSSWMSPVISRTAKTFAVSKLVDASAGYKVYIGQ